MSEALEVKMQLVQMGDTVMMDLEPPMDEERQRIIRHDPIVREIPEEFLVFKDQTPDDGEPFTEINCAKLEEGAGAVRLTFDVENFARRIEGILTAHGDHVTLDDGIKPLEERGYRFLGLTPESPPDDQDQSGN